ncbi:M42 family metallopeptidase [Mesomycoplasma hyorhinis]|uniref:M42 family metallopeptidase n=1 Tax=Mesomycoplasma hyorhinis TaxID=2100 RepID=UPI001C040DDF|nr:M42 family metallopeptidase [Mesomycoplasma hyorhinis]
MANKLDKIYDKLKVYTEIEGMSRYEDDVVAKLKENTQHLNVEYERDGLGSLIIKQKGEAKGPKIILAAHMDEVGFQVLDILKSGQIKIKPVGGVWGNAFIGAKVKLITSTDKIFYGVVGHTSVHIMERETLSKAILNKDLFMDFGFVSDEDAKNNGVEPGDRIYLSNETFRFSNPDLVAGKAIDNRAGVVVIDELVNRLANKKLPNTPYFVGTVQEEVGCRGAKTIASKIKADIAFAIDTGASHDTEGAIVGIPKLGAGVAIDIADGGTMMDPKLVNYLFKLAKEKNIPIYKYLSQGGGTDAEELQYSNAGTPTLSISIPQRYLHSTYGVISLKDISSIIDLMEEFILAFTQEDFEKISYK